MAFRTIVISNQSRLFIEDNNLCIGQDEKVFKLPIEDVSTIMIENNMSSLTTSVLSKCAENNILIFSCDDKHLPNGIFTALNQHSRMSMVLESQMNLSKPFQKRCWQKIVIQKGKNQAKCLSLLQIAGSEKIYNIADTVNSGDTNNREAYIAREYFKALFGTGFNRSVDCITNAALNYGYSIMRGAMARALVSYGYTTALGLNHSNDFNSFNLVDDFMEPFRPLVDMFVKSRFDEDCDLTKDDKIALYNLLNSDILIDEKKCSVLNAMSIMVQSFTTAISTDNPDKLKLPELIKLEHHEYE